MRKPLMEKLIRENGDLGDRMMLGLPMTVGGGVVNPGVSTFSSPDVSQDPDSFDTKGFQDAGPEGYKNVEDTDEKNPELPQPASDATYAPSVAGSQTNVNTGIPSVSNTKPNVAMRSTDVIPDEKKGINAIKFKVTPDEIIAGIDAELRDMVFKRPDVAKALVIKNLQKDPKFYSKLKFLNIDDKLDESLKGKTPQEIAIIKIMRDLYDKKYASRDKELI